MTTTMTKELRPPLTEHIELPRLTRLPYARKPWRDNPLWSLSLYPGNRCLQSYTVESECRAAVAEMKVRIKVAKALGA